MKEKLWLMDDEYREPDSKIQDLDQTDDLVRVSALLTENEVDELKFSRITALSGA